MKNAFHTFSSISNLEAAWTDRKSKLLGSCFGVDRVTGKEFGKALKANLSELSKEIRNGYQPHGLLAFPKEKDNGGFRIICVPTVRDRIVQESLLGLLRPKFEAARLDNSISYGLMTGKSKSIIGARDFACKSRVTSPWVYKTDIHKFFDNVDRSILVGALRGVVKHGSLRSILETILASEITDGIESGWKSAVDKAGIVRGRGVRQGMPLSPFFAGAYLRPLDLWLAKQGKPAARYVDDIVVFFDEEKEAHSFHKKLKHQMETLNLTIGEIDDPTSKTSLYRPEEPAEFLGMQISLTDAGYKLMVSNKTIEKIELKIQDLARISALLEKKQHLTTFGSYLDSIERGYYNAYDGADNHQALKKAVSDFLAKAKYMVLYELFDERLVALNSSQRQFAEIE